MTSKTTEAATGLQEALDHQPLSLSQLQLCNARIMQDQGSTRSQHLLGDQGTTLLYLGKQVEGQWCARTLFTRYGGYNPISGGVPGSG